jgi:hypothetical protein
MRAQGPAKRSMVFVDDSAHIEAFTREKPQESA